MPHDEDARYIRHGLRFFAIGVLLSLNMSLDKRGDPVKAANERGSGGFSATGGVRLVLRTAGEDAGKVAGEGEGPREPEPRKEGVESVVAARVLSVGPPVDVLHRGRPGAGVDLTEREVGAAERGVDADTDDERAGVDVAAPSMDIADDREVEASELGVDAAEPCADERGRGGIGSRLRSPGRARGGARGGAPAP